MSAGEGVRRAMRELAVIGVGNMGEALVRGVVARGVLAPEHVRVVDARPEVGAKLAAELGVRACGSIDEAVRGADAVILAVKPQGMAAVLGAVGAVPGVDAAVLVSVAAGVTIATLEAGLPVGTEVVRTMPNTPATVGLGAAAYALGSVRSGRGEVVAEALLGAVGICVAVPEDQLDAVTALSGSGPAYVFLMLESLIAGGQAVGLETAVAKRLATQTLYGAAALAAQSEHGPDELRRRVTSPAGTTAAALDVFYAAGWDRTVTHAMAAAKTRGQELGRIARGEVVHEPDAAARLDRAIEAAKARGKTPVAVLDVDLTLIDNSPRTRAVLAAWLDHLEAATTTLGDTSMPIEEATPSTPLEEASDTSMHIEGNQASLPIDAASDTSMSLGISKARALIETMPLVFSIRDNLARVVDALETPDAEHGPASGDRGPRDTTHRDTLLGEGLRFWRGAFFDPSFLVHDMALDGAPRAVRALVERGVTVVYVTARPGPMATATVESLARLGFPIATVGTLLWLKTDPREGDHAFKVRALDACRALGEVVLCAENEPAHANAMHAAFPKALTALITTRHSEPAPAPAPAIIHVPRLADVVGVGKKSEARV